MSDTLNRKAVLHGAGEAVTPPKRTPTKGGTASGPPSGTHSPYSPDLELWLYPRLLRLHCLVGHDGAHGAPCAHVIEHDILQRHQGHCHMTFIQLQGACLPPSSSNSG